MQHVRRNLQFRLGLSSVSNRHKTRIKKPGAIRALLSYRARCSLGKVATSILCYIQCLVSGVLRLGSCLAEIREHFGCLPHS